MTRVMREGLLSGEPNLERSVIFRINVLGAIILVNPSDRLTVSSDSEDTNCSKGDFPSKLR